MNLFGCKFCEKDEDGDQECDRKNFDTLLWAFVTVFQVFNYFQLKYLTDNPKQTELVTFT